jgi:hypothetical protein
MGRDYPYFAAIGNNDEDAWDGNGYGRARRGLPTARAVLTHRPGCHVRGYLELLTEQLERANVTQYCTGDVGENYACYYKGLYFVLSGVGTQGSGHVDFITEAFEATPARWRLCGWHKNQNLMQIGTKEDETGYDVYDTCRAYGAIVATAHFHSYSRTHTMSSFAAQRVASYNSTVTVAPGLSFAVVSAVGGKDVNDWDPDLAENPWWAAVGAQDNDLDDGALFCTFKINGDPTRAECYFESRRDGGEYDRFFISNQNPADRVVRTHDTCRQPFYELAVAGGDDGLLRPAAVGGDAWADAEPTLALAGPGVVAAFRFTDVPVPAHAKIAHAHLQLRGAETSVVPPAPPAHGLSGVDGEGARPVELHVRIALVPDAAAGVAVASNAAVLSAPVVWTTDADGFAPRAVWHSAELAPLLNALVRTPGWQAGHSLVLTVESMGRHNGLAVSTADHSACKAPSLVIELAPVGCGGMY